GPEVADHLEQLSLRVLEGDQRLPVVEQDGIDVWHLANILSEWRNQRRGGLRISTPPGRHVWSMSLTNPRRCATRWPSVSSGWLRRRCARCARVPRRVTRCRSLGSPASWRPSAPPSRSPCGT